MSTQCDQNTKKGTPCTQTLKDGKCRYHGINSNQKKSDNINIASEVSPVMSPTVEISENQIITPLYGNTEKSIESKLIINESIKVSNKMLNDNEYINTLNGLQFLLRIKTDQYKFYWCYNFEQALKFIKQAHSLYLECHEIMFGTNCHWFADIDIKMNHNEYKHIKNLYDDDDELTGAIISAYSEAINNSFDLHKINSDADFTIISRSRNIDNGYKISLHLISKWWMPIVKAKALAMDVYDQLKSINTKLPIDILVNGFDTQVYRRNGSLSMCGGWKDKSQNSMYSEENCGTQYISYYNDNSINIDMSKYISIDSSIGEISNDFIKEALKHVENISDWCDAFDLDNSTIKGHSMIVRRYNPSHCSICNRTHDSDNTMQLIFCEEQGKAFWKCLHKEQGRAKMFYKRVIQIKQIKENKETKEISEKTKPLDILREELLCICKDRYRRVEQTGAIYERKYDYYYTRKFDDPALFLNHIFSENELYSTITPNVHMALIYFIKHIIHRDFQFMRLDYEYIGFCDGVYDLNTATFIPTDEINKPIQVRKLINKSFIIGETPLLDTYLRYQFHEDDIEFIYFILGRLMTRLDDHFDFMVLLYGQGGSGKSLLMKLVQQAFASDQLGILSSSFQGQFGLCEFANRQLVCSDDMPSNLAKTLDKGDFLKMMTRGSISCPVKGKGSIEVHDWDIPTIINSNSLPNYKDVSGEIVRRVMVVNFENVIEQDQINTNLESDIINNEISTFIHRCRITYLQFKQKYNGKGVETFCPSVFIENRNLLRLAVNNTCRFINERFEYKEGEMINVPTLNKLFKTWMKDLYDLKKNPSENINAQSIEAIDNRYQYKKAQFCKHCLKEHKKGCCLKYNRTERSSREVVYNIVQKSYIEDSDLEEFANQNK